LEAQELAEAINGFLKLLDVDKRNIFIRRYWYLDSVVDIANLYGISQSKVKTTLFRCRNRLREYLDQEGYVL
jgi:RNA polymerase sigma-70 factor (ECF subfamily)